MQSNRTPATSDRVSTRYSPGSWLLVNGAQYGRFAPATSSRADIVVLDTEDAVAPTDKLAARDNVIRWLGDCNTDWVRVNGFGTQWWADDLDALGKSSVGGVMHDRRQGGASAERDRRADRRVQRPETE